MISETVRVTFSAADIGNALAKGSDESQREVFVEMASVVDDMGGDWAMQCRSIVDGVGGNGLSRFERDRIASMLEVLLDHLREPVIENSSQ